MAASIPFSEISGWLLLKTSYSEDFFRRTIKWSEQTSHGFLHSASHYNSMKEVLQ